MADDVADPLAVDPDRALSAQSVQELLTRPRRHSLSSLAIEYSSILTRFSLDSPPRENDKTLKHKGFLPDSHFLPPPPSRGNRPPPAHARAARGGTRRC